MSHNQSRATPENMPPKRNSTSKLPSAFCSGPCKIKNPSLPTHILYPLSKFIFKYLYL